MVGLGRRLAGAWAYTQPSGGTSRRVMALGLWGLMRLEESLTDVYYRRHGLWTTGRDWDLHGAGTELNGYAPIRWRPLREIFRSCPVTSDDVLLDYGSGKGRTVIWAAANYRFRRIIGVELDTRLHDGAQANLARWDGRLLCDEIEFICADATVFEMPDDVTIVYLSNPFTGDVFEKVVCKIQESIARNPRELVILYYHPRMDDSLIRAGFAVERQQVTPPNDWTIYRWHQDHPA